MAGDYIRREDALKALYNDYAYAAMDVIKRLPAADVAEVVRCKDCKHKLRTVANGVVICREKHGMVRPSLDDFCSYGERREGGNGDEAD